jgi:mycothiol synthase
VAPVSEAFALAARRERPATVHLLRRVGSELVGYAQVADAGSADAAAELVVDPAHRRAGHGRALLDAVLEEGAHALWAHGDLAPARALASSAGLEPTRSLHLMTRELTDADVGSPSLPEGYSVRAFEPGRDDEAWVRINAAAFADHPEQGRMTVADLRERMEQPWFDPAGLILVERAGRVVAFHWTKVEHGSGSGAGWAHGSDPNGVRNGDGWAHGSDPNGVRNGDGWAHGSDPNGVRGGTGEVYVVGVDPAEQGRGLGGPVTALGLAYLAGLGLAEVHLYVDGDNPAARRTYERLGFRDAAVDVQYSPTRGST